MNTDRFSLRIKLQDISHVIFIFLLFTLHCHKDRNFTLHIGQSFYALEQLSYERFYGQYILRSKKGESMRVKGIYTVADSVFLDFPMLRYYTAGSGLQYALLDTGLNVHDGDLIEVEGTVVRKMIRLKGTKVTYKEELLKPETFRTVTPSHTLKSIVQKEYLAMKDDLQKEITPEDSQLILSEKPRWFVVWSETDGNFIVSTRFLDLMYQAEIDFVFRGFKKRFTDVYAVEWFKGE